MERVTDIVGAALFIGFAIWGWSAPAAALRRRDELQPRALLVTYWRHIRLIPEAIRVSAVGAFRHPFGWDGPIFGFVLMVAVLFLGAASGAVYSVVGPDRAEALSWTPVVLVLAVGLGIRLVRDTPGVEDRVVDGPRGPGTGAHFRK